MRKVEDPSPAATTGEAPVCGDLSPQERGEVGAVAAMRSSPMRVSSRRGQPRPPRPAPAGRGRRVFEAGEGFFLRLPIHSRFLLFACVAFILHTPPITAAEQPAHRANGDLAIQARDIFSRYCVECHRGSSDPGQSKLKLLDHKQLTAKGRPVPLVGSDRSLILDLVKDGSMPPANKPAPKPHEVAILEQWVKAGAPAYPEAFDERYVLQAVADDLESVNGGNTNSRYMYVSFAHLIREGQPLPKLAEAERRLSAALALAGGAPVVLKPVDAPATLFRIEIGDSWLRGEIFHKIEGRKPAGVASLSPYGLLALEYPHATALPAGDPLAKRLEHLLQLIHPFAVFRGDWLSAALVNGEKLAPLGEDIRSLLVLRKARADGTPIPDGPPFPRSLGTAPPFVAEKFADGRTAFPPLSGWYVGDVSPNPAPFTLTAELVAGGQSVKSVKVDQRFKLKVQADRRVYLTLLMVQADGEVNIQEINGSVLQAGATRELSPGPNGFNISGIITGGDSAKEYFVLFASETQFPLPYIVRSRHAERPVWRFQFIPSEKEPFDPNTVMRKVIAIPLTK